ncbi:unnamed protein product [Staurois parvus]|uniref:Uncharacterized protein n=1 Tax=Staurois parvus TaxID=386267 RepID=A0ABN9D5Z5_9NEOB|nr:unnamed protein product [Staurois parvus]
MDTADHKMSLLPCDQLCPMYNPIHVQSAVSRSKHTVTEQIGTDHQALIISAQQCHPSVPPIDAQQCRQSAAPPVSVANHCCISVPPHQCPPVPLHQCSLSVPITAAYQCSSLINAHQ